MNSEIITNTEDNNYWQNKYMYLLADLENYRKRNRKERELLVKTASKEMVLGLLEIIDDFDNAIQHEATEGYRLIYDKIQQFMKTNGIERFGKKGDTFDPSIHDCLFKSTGTDNTLITGVVQYGYMLNGVLIRVAKVIV